ncbi:MAG: hypothetical protein HY228_00815 [Candidatus Yonathbacteria bacterium]|nr:hypothetical protein [Candidatus Yonathbacteria bacterium]
MESILYGASLIGGVIFAFFLYLYARRAGWRCVSNREKTCGGDTISEFCTAEDQHKNRVEI